jgi:hypothetical protein
VAVVTANFQKTGRLKKKFGRGKLEAVTRKSLIPVRNENHEKRGFSAKLATEPETQEGPDAGYH